MIYKFYETQGRRMLYQTDAEAEEVAWDRFNRFMGLLGALVIRDKVKLVEETNDGS